ncbi:hypothetical protein NE237_015630 [Protea cynaroides]|uniref:Uncharacterized protein n=1 Tax=Protea cynaroides TaxID=273540 RepID=A0A9Q0KEE9_9MAGN|nr:hypothetical protein NE237_015630 [Protea cynaroides]
MVHLGDPSSKVTGQPDSISTIDMTDMRLRDARNQGERRSHDAIKDCVSIVIPSMLRSAVSGRAAPSMSPSINMGNSAPSVFSHTLVGDSATLLPFHRRRQ